MFASSGCHGVTWQQSQVNIKSGGRESASGSGSERGEKRRESESESEEKRKGKEKDESETSSLHYLGGRFQDGLSCSSGYVKLSRYEADIEGGVKGMGQARFRTDGNRIQIDDVRAEMDHGRGTMVEAEIRWQIG